MCDVTVLRCAIKSRIQNKTIRYSRSGLATYRHTIAHRHHCHRVRIKSPQYHQPDGEVASKLRRNKWYCCTVVHLISMIISETKKNRNKMIFTNCILCILQTALKIGGNHNQNTRIVQIGSDAGSHNSHSKTVNSANISHNSHGIKKDA